MLTRICLRKPIALALLAYVFADVGFAITQAIRHQDRLAVFAQRLDVSAPRRVQGHGEEAEFHDQVLSLFIDL